MNPREPTVVSETRVGAGVERIRVRNDTELLHALEQMTRPIMIESSFLKCRLQLLRVFGRTPLFGSLLVRLFQPLLVRAIERGYRIDLDWKFTSVKGALTMYPRRGSKK
jgi:hypothetical protein